MIARVFSHYPSTHKVLYAVPFRRLAHEKGDEIAAVWTSLQGSKPPTSCEIRVVEGRHPSRDITMTRIVVATFEHIVQYLACANTEVKSWRTPTRRLILAKAFKLVIVDEAHMMFDGGRGRLVNQIVCLARCLRIPLLLLTGTVSKAEWRHLTLCLQYTPYWYPCKKKGPVLGSIGYAPLQQECYSELKGSRKRKYTQDRRQVTTDDWRYYLDYLGTHALTVDDLHGVIVFGHTRAAVEDMFYKYVTHVTTLSQRIQGMIKRGEPLPRGCYPVAAFDGSHTLE
jgi:hypothetical protein